MWAHIIDAVTHWPWPTIAAFASAIAVLWVARAETRERSQGLGRQVVVDVNTSVLEWSIEAARFIGLVQKHLVNKVTADELNGPGLERFSTATASTNRALTLAKLATNDFDLHRHIAEAEMHIWNFLDAINRPVQGDQSERDRLLQISHGGVASLDGFGRATEALIKRGFMVYEQRRSLRYKFARWRFDRAARAEATPTAAQRANVQQQHNATE